MMNKKTINMNSSQLKNKKKIKYKRYNKKNKNYNKVLNIKNKYSKLLNNSMYNKRIPK